MDQTVSALHKRIETLSLQASALRDALQRSEENTDSAVAALDSFDHHISAIEASIRPAQVRPLSAFPSGEEGEVTRVRFGRVAGEGAGHHDGEREHRQDHRYRRGHPRAVRDHPPGERLLPSPGFCSRML
jgi:hypothetical protein